MRLLSVLVLSPLLSLPAQTLSFGMKGGMRATDDLDSYYATSDSPRYAVGPTAALALGRGFAVEVNALERRVGYNYVAAGFGPRDSVRIVANGNSWEFPILLRKSTRDGLFVAAGYAPRVIHGSAEVTIVQASGPYYDLQVSRHVTPSPWDTTHGILSAVGVEIPLRRFRISPEARYTFWTSSSVNEFGSRGFSIVSNQHQLDFLVGVTWTVR